MVKRAQLWAWFLAPWILWAHTAGAAIDALEFDTQLQQQRFKDLTGQLRCVVCQNQSLADSNAGLAADLREQVHRMIGEGKSDEEIVGFMVRRYGDFVLYRPPLRASTYLLWAGPLILLVVGLVVVFAIAGTRRAQAPEPTLSDEERRAVERLTRQDRETNP